MTAFLLPHAIVAVLVGAYVLDRPWAFMLPTLTFLAALVVDQLFHVDGRSALAPHVAHRSWRLVLFAWVPLHVAALICGLHAVAHLTQGTQDFWPRLFAIAVSLGMVAGTLGGALAHELMHVPRTLDRILGTSLMSLITYGHFAIGHVAGHHRLVGTMDDPSTARRGESLYPFLVRTFTGSMTLAWRAERTRLRRHHRAIWSIRNRLLQIFACEALLYGVIYALIGLTGVAFFALQSLVGSSLLEVMNYVMHYGLRRGRLPSGRLEPVRPDCSWNTQRLATTYLMCGIGLHSLHHCRPSKPFPTLSLLAGAPELPGGLFAMFVLAWFPPLWRRVMDPLVDLWMRQPLPASIGPEAGGR